MDQYGDYVLAAYAVALGGMAGYLVLVGVRAWRVRGKLGSKK
jgi:hypothetical protein